MKKNILFTVIYFIISTSAFGAGFEKRWFWFYCDSDEQYHVVITYDPENAERCSITTNDGKETFYEPNPFDFFASENITHWPHLFDIAEKIRQGELSIGSSLTIPGNEPLLKHIVETPTVFKVKSSEKYSKRENFHKIAFESATGSTIIVFLEKINESEYRVSAVFLQSKGRKRYSYRDYSFRRDFGDGGNSGASGTAVNFLHYQSVSPYKIYLENKLKDSLIDNRKGLTVPLTLLAELFIFTSWKISVAEN